jgi:hypothetical protein
MTDLATIHPCDPGRQPALARDLSPNAGPLMPEHRIV